MNERIKKWLVDNCDVKADATDEEFQKAFADALASGKMTPEKFAELSKTRRPKRPTSSRRR